MNVKNLVFFSNNSLKSQVLFIGVGVCCKNKSELGTFISEKVLEELKYQNI